MCGVLALVRCDDKLSDDTGALAASTAIVRHRGPDDEGYLLWRRGRQAEVFAGPDTAAASVAEHRLPALPRDRTWDVGLGHRRLAIVDLSARAHQPMLHPETGLAIVYNGEIYNYIELREDLTRRGHRFRSTSDTEVLLCAWAEWGPACLARLNGMFAFAVLDPRGAGTLHVARDRFGVKPLYWARVGSLLAFASEIKQIRALPGFSPRVDGGTVRDYLAAGLLDHTRHTFDAQIQQLRGGERAVVALDRPDAPPEIIQWYELVPERWRGAPGDAATRFRELLTDSVRLRLRADVPVGSCLSGGLDSSAIVCLASQLLGEQGPHRGQVTVTACFEDERYDEWRFARQVVEQTGATAVRVWPSIDRLNAEFEANLWHMDEPYGSTSQFSQWCVFAGAAEARLKVMLDGQGSDEQLAGYSGNDTALMTGLLAHGSMMRLAREVRGFRRRHGAWPIAQGVLAVRNLLPAIDAILPARLRYVAGNPPWLRTGAPSHADFLPSRNLNASLRDQTLRSPLPVLLRYEDRNSMAWSIESRVPFLDYRLVQFLAGLPDRLKLQDGVTKRVMRDGLRGVLPEAVRSRTDKMGFVTPEEQWLRGSSATWFRRNIDAAISVAPDVLDADRVRALLDDTVAGSVPFSFAPWRILCFGAWVAASGSRQVPSLAGAQH